MEVSFYNMYKIGDKLEKGDEYECAEHCVSDLEYYPKHIYLYTVKLTHGFVNAKIEDIDLDAVKEKLELANADEAQYNSDVRREYFGGAL